VDHVGLDGINQAALADGREAVFGEEALAGGQGDAAEAAELGEFLEVLDLSGFLNEVGAAGHGAVAEFHGHGGSGFAVEVNADLEGFADGFASRFQIGNVFADGFDGVNDLAVGGDEGVLGARPAFLFGLEPVFGVLLGGVATGVNVHVNAVAGLTAEQAPDGRAKG
jgi:hypothetical protein